MGTFTHVITVPPMTDTMMLVGAYRALMEAMGIDCTALAAFPVCQGVTHMVEQAQQILTNDWQDTFAMLQVSYMLHGGLTVTDMRFMTNCCIFTFSYPDGPI